MDFFLESNNILILTVAAVSGTMLLLNLMRKGGASGAVDVQEAIRLVNQQQGIFVDIRSADQFKKGFIAQSRNLPSADLESKSGSLPKDKPIIVVCDSGQSATSAVRTLRKLGFEQAVSLQGGLRSWTQDNLPLVKKK